MINAAVELINALKNYGYNEDDIKEINIELNEIIAHEYNIVENDYLFNNNSEGDLLIFLDFYYSNYIIEEQLIYGKILLKDGNYFKRKNSYGLESWNFIEKKEN